ncbi:MAG: CYTH domain-containing protein [Bacteroidetes bacterium]|jgi:adenylate cyclase|nr:CYTH domain-containing protein [Bacteroidota bacterium]MDA0879762.1 CYTH domain-containing protein [Bacteroidota bacterium]MDA1115750.1 CYTH domain-containing protein [Bacteroidota bacterium]
MTEVERKFLVTSEDFKLEATNQFQIVQGFLNTHPERTVRIRVNGDIGFITVKGLSSDSGASRYEWEQEIPIQEAQDLLRLCETPLLEKTRYEIPFGTVIFEVDEFKGDNDGLIVAEVELTKESDHFEKPDWLGDEVTGQIKYYNSQLVKNPFKSW